MSSLTILNVISVNVPGMASQYNNMVLGFSQLDILPSDEIYNNVFSFDDNDEALNPYFDKLGYSSKYSVRNMGSTFIFFLGYLFLYIILIISYYLNFKKVFNYLKEILVWNGGLRFCIQQYLQIFLSSCINLSSVDMKKIGDAVSTVTTFILFFFFLSLPYILISIIFAHEKLLNSQTFKEKFGTLIEFVKTNTIIKAQWNVVQLLKWKFTIISLILLRNYPSLQIITLLSIQSLVQVYLLAARPY